MSDIPLMKFSLAILICIFLNNHVETLRTAATVRTRTTGALSTIPYARALTIYLNQWSRSFSINR